MSRITANLGVVTISTIMLLAGCAADQEQLGSSAAPVTAVNMSDFATLLRV